MTASSPFQNHDPALLAPQGISLPHLIYDRLTMVDADDQIVPGLATKATLACPKVIGADKMPWTNLGLFDSRTVAMAAG